MYMLNYMHAMGLVRTLAHTKVGKILKRANKGKGVTGLNAVKRLESVVGEGVKRHAKRQVLKFKM
jgi:hypothetical protein